jgi:acetylornithine/succinyldiaminopimelate/putrescine aminotransferase
LSGDKPCKPGKVLSCSINLKEGGYAEQCLPLFVVDKVQTGIGRTGKFWTIDHWIVKPGMLCVDKALLGRFVAAGAITQKNMNS